MANTTLKDDNLIQAQKRKSVFKFFSRPFQLHFADCDKCWQMMGLTYRPRWRIFFNLYKFYFRPFINTMTNEVQNCNIKAQLGFWTRDCRMVGTNESTELLQSPISVTNLPSSNFKRVVLTGNMFIVYNWIAFITMAIIGILINSLSKCTTSPVWPHLAIIPTLAKNSQSFYGEILYVFWKDFCYWTN